MLVIAEYTFASSIHCSTQWLYQTRIFGIALEIVVLEFGNSQRAISLGIVQSLLVSQTEINVKRFCLSSRPTKVRRFER